MKTLEQFTKEQKSEAEAARILNKNQSTIHKWVKSGREFYVKEDLGKYLVLEVK